jgi:hypothetical protein
MLVRQKDGKSQGSMQYDRQKRYIAIERAGLLTPDEARAFLDNALQLIETMRREFGYVRVLVLNRDAMVQSQEVAEIFASTPSQVISADDRVALVPATALMKLQVGRIVKDRPERVFASAEEAIAWLREPPAEAR